MQATKDTVVSFHYKLSDSQNQEVETSHGTDPSLALLGHGNIMQGVEDALEGKAAGDTLTVELSAEQAFGVRKEGLQQRVPAKYLKHEGKMKPGQAVRINTEQGVQAGTVIKVGKFNVDVDMNHPLADQAITFEIEVVDVRAASADEIAHGHAHGKGGVEH